MKSRKKIRLGDLLVENKIISQAQLESALTEQKKSGRKLGRVLVDNGYILEASLLEFLSRQLDVPYVDLKSFKFDRDAVRLLPELHARRHRAIALEVDGDTVLVGMADPTDIFAFDELSRTLKRHVNLAVVSEADLLHAFDTVYRRTEEIENLAEALSEELSERDIDLGQLAVASDVSDAPVVKLIQSLFEDAVQIGASDVHVEPDEHVLRIRQRVDGVLQEQVMDEKRIASALVLRVKLMAGLDISEKRLPQDGRFSVKVKGRTIDVRLSTMPVQHGESVVMRLLDQSAGALGLDQLGMSLDVRRRFERAIAQPHGMVLVTGPTGSGKTTSLYAALAAINRAETKIITVEDPVEYRLPRVNQVQVRTDIGLTFGKVLRSVLRQDPDVVLVGEMRDEETVAIGLRAAITGHLVLSTLHTNDAVSTVSRLLDMGAPGYLLASALEAVVAQRLVRKVCGECVRPYQPTDYELSWLASLLSEGTGDPGLSVGAGCHHCGHTGYRGRVGVYELLEIADPMRVELGRADSSAFVEVASAALGARTLVHSALSQALRGMTTLEEVMRVAGERAPEQVLDGVDDLSASASAPDFRRAGAGA
jgi:MSHA biogenesis protein MshE